MPYPLKDNYKRNTPLRLLSASWLNWVANFFNACQWNNISANMTDDGIESTIGIDGDDGLIVNLFNDDSVPVNYFETMTIENGLITAVAEFV